MNFKVLFCLAIFAACIALTTCTSCSCNVKNDMCAKCSINLFSTGIKPARPPLYHDLLKLKRCSLLKKLSCPKEENYVSSSSSSSSSSSEESYEKQCEKPSCGCQQSNVLPCKTTCQVDNENYQKPCNCAKPCKCHEEYVAPCKATYQVNNENQQKSCNCAKPCKCHEEFVVPCKTTYQVNNVNQQKSCNCVKPCKCHEEYDVPCKITYLVNNQNQQKSCNCAKPCKCHEEYIAPCKPTCHASIEQQQNCRKPCQTECSLSIKPTCKNDQKEKTCKYGKSCNCQYNDFPHKKTCGFVSEIDEYICGCGDTGKCHENDTPSNKPACQNQKCYTKQLDCGCGKSQNTQVKECECFCTLVA